MNCRRKGCKARAHPEDPYCSADCCRVDHGVITLAELELTRERKERRVVGQQPPQFSDKRVSENVASVREQGGATWM